MGLEAYFNKDRLNVKSLAVENPDKSSATSFNPEKEISVSGWHSIIKEIEAARIQGKWNNFIFLSADLKVLSPDRFSQLIFDERCYKGFEEQLLSARAHDNIIYYCKLLAALKIIDPHWTETAYLGPEYWQSISDTLKINFEIPNWNDFWGQAAIAKIVFQDKLPEQYEKFEKEYLSKALQRTEEFLENQRESGFIDVNLGIPACMKIAVPQGFDIEGMDYIDLPQVRREIDKQRQGNNWTYILELVKKMKILSAGKIKLAKEGLELLPPKNKGLKQEDVPLPEPRKF